MLIETGSTWYAWGHHWRVTNRTTRDGKPAVRLVCLTAKRKAPCSVIVKLLLRYATETDPTDYESKES